MIVSALGPEEEAPMDLLLLADPSEELVRSYLAEGLCFVARQGGERIGVVLMRENRPGLFEVMNLAVREKDRKRGVGKTLLRFALDEAARRGGRCLEVGTGNSSIWQLLFYQKCGFRMVQIIPDFFRDHYSERIYENGIECRDMIRLERKLQED
ncbi:MAG: GNAT family N-acetyltransferase [Spirochaetales bacterium]|nr:GNAT family N-acetyltransferase [Spirochaetales bacterium]